MYKFGPKSLKVRGELHPDLQIIVDELIKKRDVSLLCGYRGEEDQNKAFESGNSKLKYPQSKHNKKPSEAVDAAPYPIDWSDIKRFEDMCNLVEEIAKAKNIKIRLGRNFSFVDWPHIELID
ncbi:MAG TPA: M15 family peptidase [Patescibacteria group bacterium]|nr:M15 family peptidase [Patescibacteria group bacterium]